MKKILVLFMLVVLFTACGSTEKKNAPEVVVYELKHKFHKELFLKAPDLNVMGDYLIVGGSFQRDSIYRFYSIDRGMEEVAAYGGIGNGPGEFIQPKLTYTDGNMFAINDINHNILAVVAVHENDGKIKIEEVKRLKGVYKPKKNELVLRDILYMKIGEFHYVSSLEAGEGCFFNLLDSVLLPIESFGESPIKEKVDSYTSRNRLQGSKEVYGNTLFFGTTNLPYLASYTLRDGKMEKDWSIYYDTPHYVISNGDVKFIREHSKGPLLGLQADDKYIICYIAIICFGSLKPKRLIQIQMKYMYSIVKVKKLLA